MAHKKTFKEKLAEYKAHAKKGLVRAREAGGKAKPFVLAAGGGAAVHYALRFAGGVDSIKGVLDYSPYAPGGVALIAAVAVNKKNHTVAMGMAGAAGFLIAQAFDGHGTVGPGPTATPTAKPQTKGYGDDAASMQAPDVSALELPDSAAFDDTGVFQTADAEMYN